MVMLKEEITVISLENVEVQHLEIRCVSRGERGGGGEGAQFENLNKIALILGKNALTLFIYGLNFSFKMLF